MATLSTHSETDSEIIDLHDSIPKAKEMNSGSENFQSDEPKQTTHIVPQILFCFSNGRSAGDPDLTLRILKLFYCPYIRMCAHRMKPSSKYVMLVDRKAIV